MGWYSQGGPEQALTTKEIASQSNLTIGMRPKCQDATKMARISLLKIKLVWPAGVLGPVFLLKWYSMEWYQDNMSYY